MLGYVPAEHFDDKPLSGLEFFSYVDSLKLPEEVYTCIVTLEETLFEAFACYVWT